MWHPPEAVKPSILSLQKRSCVLYRAAMSQGAYELARKVIDAAALLFGDLEHPPLATADKPGRCDFSHLLARGAN